MHRARGLCGPLFHKAANLSSHLVHGTGNFIRGGSSSAPVFDGFSFIVGYKAETDVQNVAVDGDILNLMPKGVTPATSVHSTEILALDYQGVYHPYAIDAPVWQGGRVVATPPLPGPPVAEVIKFALRSDTEWTANQAEMEAIYGVNGYHTTLASWASSIPADISGGTGSKEIWILEAYNDFPSGIDRVDIMPSTITDEEGYLVLRGAATEKHDGNSYDSGPWMQINEWKTFTWNSPYLQIYDFAFRTEQAGASSSIIITLSGINNKFYNNITHINGTVGARSLVLSGLLSESYSCVFISDVLSAGSVGIEGVWDNIANSAFNHRFINFDKSAREIKIKNCVAINCTDTSLLLHSDSANNATSAASGHAAFSVFNVSSADGVDFTSPSTGDYSIAAGSTLIDQGEDLSSTFTSDIIGNTITIPYDIGPFTYD